MLAETKSPQAQVCGLFYGSCLGLAALIEAQAPGNDIHNVVIAHRLSYVFFKYFTITSLRLALVGINDL